MRAIDVFWVAAGGGAGSVFRWFVGRVVGERFHGDFPVSTFVINVTGAFVIAYLSVLFAVDWQDRYGIWLSAAMLTGFLGGYTTFSSMQLDALKLVQRQRGRMAVAYITISVISGLGAAAAGAWLARAHG